MRDLENGLFTLFHRPVPCVALYLIFFQTISWFRYPGECLGECDNVGKLVTKEGVGETLVFQVVISKQPDGKNGVKTTCSSSSRTRGSIGKQDGFLNPNIG